MTNKLSKYLNYKEILLLNIRLLLTLQNKLTLLFNKNLLTQSKRKTSNNLILVFQNKLMLLFDEKLLTQSKREILDNLTLVLQLARVSTSSAKIKDFVAKL